MFSRRKSKGKGKNANRMSTEQPGGGGSLSKESTAKGRRKKKATMEDTKTQGTVEEKTKEEDLGRDEKNEKATSDGKNDKVDPVYQKMVEEAEKNLATITWYHGLMPREEIEDLLKDEGDYIVRKTEVSGTAHYALSIFWNHKFHHLLLKSNSSGRWHINSASTFSLITDLVDFYTNSKDDAHALPNGLKIIKPISRQPWYILHDNVKLVKKLGEGNFGEVHLGELQVDRGTRTLQVAVKTLKGKLGKKDRCNFVKEASLMRRFQHDNIVRIYGVASQREPLMIILELASGGNLKSHVKEHPDLTIDHITRYTIEAAQGMEYLSGNNVIHRDIAARNCLLSASDHVKISDFGLSVANKDKVTEVKLKSVPVKWLAPETLIKGVFSKETDVWSFGVLMWELWSRCKKDPYPGMTNTEARRAIISELRLQVPEGTPDNIGTMMNKCWKFTPEERPNFKDIVKGLGGIVAVEKAVVTVNEQIKEEDYFGLPANK